jgi:predicted NUDIX family NTP pyrophosphohydrolase
MRKRSAGLLLYRVRGDALQVFLVHPGGPFWTGKDIGAWGIPKGEAEADEDLLAVARREFEEETGCVPGAPPRALTPVRQPSGKIVYAWAVEGNCDPDSMTSNTFSMEWPPKSGRVQEFPEIDRAGWFDLPTARRKISKGQLGLLDQLERLVGDRG